MCIKDKYKEYTKNLSKSIEEDIYWLNESITA